MSRLQKSLRQIRLSTVDPKRHRSEKINSPPSRFRLTFSNNYFFLFQNVIIPWSSSYISFSFLLGKFFVFLCNAISSGFLLRFSPKVLTNEFLDFNFLDSRNILFYFYHVYSLPINNRYSNRSGRNETIKGQTKSSNHTFIIIQF